MKSSPGRRAALEKALLIAAELEGQDKRSKGQSALARRVGGSVGQGHVWKWIRAGQVPPEQVLPVVRAVDGRVTPHELRPDIYPDPDWMPEDLQAPAEQVEEG